MYYASEPIKIGKHDWRVIVVDSRFGNSRCTEYQWRGMFGYWRSSRDWPSYDINNGMTLGLPKTLAKLYEREKDALSAVLKESAIIQ